MSPKAELGPRGLPAGSALPSFFVIGAPKCGTTSLHLYLDQHPGIEMSSIKEPAIFAEPGFESRLGRYKEMFRGETSTRGESSAVYSQHPRWPAVPGRIRKVVAEARFIYVVRDPIERAISHWRQHVADGKEPRPLSEAMSDWEREDSLYLCPSRYATQIRHYLGHFDPERILVLDHAELSRDTEAALSSVFRFLDVDQAFRSPRFAERLNQGEQKRRPTAIGRSLEGIPLAAARRLPLPARFRERARGLVSRPVAAQPLEPELRRRIAASLGDEIEWLREFAGRSFPDWSV